MLCPGADEAVSAQWRRHWAASAGVALASGLDQRGDAAYQLLTMRLLIVSSVAVAQCAYTPPPCEGGPPETQLADNIRSNAMLFAAIEVIGVEAKLRAAGCIKGCGRGVPPPGARRSNFPRRATGRTGAEWPWRSAPGGSGLPAPSPGRRAASGRAPPPPRQTGMRPDVAVPP